jgi:alkylation response protein AidB-like acyl-CoA dehydrogenase
VLEIAERARERKVEHLESLNPTPAALSLPPIQQAIVDLALEIEAADRARLRWELQEAAWAFDNYCEDRLTVLGVSERAARLLHMGIRVEDAMDFEKDLNQHEDDYNAKPGRNGL